MKITESECIDCGFPCMGISCKHYEVTRYYCDNCEDETKLYEFDGQELCIECIEKRLPVVKGTESWT